MRDHNETFEAPEHREHPNTSLGLISAGSAPYTIEPSFSPWGGDNLEESEEQPCGCFVLSVESGL